MADHHNKNRIPNTARDILLSKVDEFIAQAEEHVLMGAEEEALSLYQRSAEIRKDEKDPAFKDKLQQELKSILESKSTISESAHSPSSQYTLDRRDSTSCEVIISIENISVHRITGLGGSHQEATLIGKGVLCIMKCTPVSIAENTDFSSPPQRSKIETKSELELEEIALESENKTEERKDEQESRKMLHILQLQPSDDESVQFQFPLTKSIPCLSTSNGQYILPMSKDLFYGIVFPRNIPQAYVLLFENALKECCTLRKAMVPHTFHNEEDQVEQQALTTTVSTSSEIIIAPELPIAARALNVVSTGINTGATKIVEGITTGSQIIAATARTGGEFIRRRITPGEEPVVVPAPIANIAGKLSPVCVAVSKVLLSSLAAVADEIGNTIARGISSTAGTKSAATKATGATATAAKEMGKTSLKAVAEVWDALEKAGALLLEETSSVTVSLVEKKYGAHAAQVTKEGMKVTGNIIETAYNFNQLGVKKIAKSTASRVGKRTVKDIMAPKVDEKGEKLALPAPDEKLALPAPEERLALPAPEEKLSLTAPSLESSGNVKDNENEGKQAE